MNEANTITLPATLRLNTKRIVTLSFSVVVIAAVGTLMVFMGLSSKSAGITAIGVLFYLLVALTLFSFRAKLTLTQEGFVFKGLFKSLAVRWADVEDFVVWDFQTIGWNYLPEYRKLTTMRKINRGAGTEASIPGQFGGMSLSELVTVMNRLRTSCQTVLPLTPEQQFGLAVSAILTEMNGQRHDCLHGDKPGISLKTQALEILSSYWDVSNPEQLEETLQWLSEKGHREEYEVMHGAISNAGPISDPLELLKEESVKQMSADERKEFQRQAACVNTCRQKHSSILAWDLCRLVSVARFGAGAGYLTEAEAWQWIRAAAWKLRLAFDSWHEMSENYLVGREFSGFSDAEKKVERTIVSLLDANNGASVWNQVPWGGATKV